MSGDVSFTITRNKRDYMAGIVLNTRHSRATLLVFAACALINGAIGYAMQEGPFSWERLGTAVALSFYTVAILTAGLMFALFMAARASRRSPGALNEIAYVFSENGVKVRSAVGSSEAVWTTFDAALESRGHFVLRQKPGVLQIIPKRDLNADVLARLRALLRAHLTGLIRLQEA